MRRHRLSALTGTGLVLIFAIWGAAILLPAPPFGSVALQRALRLLVLASSAEGLAAMPRAAVWLDGAAAR